MFHVKMVSKGCEWVFSKEQSQHTGRWSTGRVWGKSLCVGGVKVWHEGGGGGGGGDGGGAAVCGRSQTPHSLTPPGCWPGARAGVEAGVMAGVTEGPRRRRWSGRGWARGGRRSSGAEWCWGTGGEPLLLYSKHSKYTQPPVYQVHAAVTFVYEI